MNRPRLLTLITALSMTPLPALPAASVDTPVDRRQLEHLLLQDCGSCHGLRLTGGLGPAITPEALAGKPDRKSTRLNSSHVRISYAVFCLKKKKNSHCYTM